MCEIKALILALQLAVGLWPDHVDPSGYYEYVPEVNTVYWPSGACDIDPYGVGCAKSKLLEAQSRLKAAEAMREREITEADQRKQILATLRVCEKWLEEAK